MKVITFFGLTLLSILIQFTVIEFIDGKIKNDDKDDLKISSQNEDVDKPHALYYRSQESSLKEIKESTPSSATEYLNVSLLQVTIDTTTDLSTTIIDELYDENTSLSGTTDATHTTTEFENVTEINLFDRKNHTITKPNILKKTSTGDCSCNLLFKVCDINCCCDSDCTDPDLKMFKCEETTSTSINQDDLTCQSHLSDLHWYYGNEIMNMFCIAKTNLPERRNINTAKHDRKTVDRSFKWHSDENHQSPNTFKRKPYMYGDHLWVLKNGSIKYMDLPIPLFNGYCTGRKPLTFLKEETIKCIVKLKDLEMFEIIKASQEATVVSVLENSNYTSTLNCSTLHCTNWSIIVCDGGKCVDYNKSIHEPSCTDINCTNLALEFDYIFYYYDFKILNATIKLHIRKVFNIMPFMVQIINVRFVIANETDNIVKMSGNPGYFNGLPVIVSYMNENHSEQFYNTSASGKYILQPDNDFGLCKIRNGTNNYLTFNGIKRIKCRFPYAKEISMFNDTSACTNINNDILEIFGVNKKMFISPYGNPENLKDNDWIPLTNDILDKEPVYGEYNGRGSKLHCYNLITRMSHIFTFANTGENKQIMKILSARINLSAGNVTFNMDETSVVLTIDTMFIDETKPSMYEYAAGPHLDIHLPKDFFFPFPNSGSNNLKCNVIISVFISIFVIQQIK